MEPGTYPKRCKPRNQTQSPSNSSEDSRLPPELISEILSRLPVKQLSQFKCVSKFWHALISSPEFVKYHVSVLANDKDYTHHRLVLTQPRYVLKHCSLRSLFNDSVIEAFNLDFPMDVNPFKYFWVVGSVNGLLCLSIGFTDLFLWNPSIRKFKKLPDSGPTISGNLFKSYSFKYGFGYDESNDDYKVVGMFDVSSNPNHLEVKIYSLKSDSWRSKGNLPGARGFIKTGKFVNGKLHWANITSRGIHKNWTIASFDLTNEKWGRVEQPCYGEGDSLLILAAFGGDLSVICNYERSHAEVWVMKEYGVKESWTKMYTIKCPNDPRKVMFSTFISPTFFMSNKHEMLVVSGSTFKMIHNLEDGSIRYPQLAHIHCCLDAIVYIESLVCPALFHKMNQEHNKNEE